MDEATRRMIAEEFTIWGQFLIGCSIILQWASITTNAEIRTRLPRFARFFSWSAGILALAVFVVALMNTIPFSGGCPNPLHPWMRIVLVLGYLAALGYIVKRRSTLPPSTIPK
jgi:hypothetical protein